MKLTNRLRNLDAYSRSNKYADRIYSELLYLYHLNRQKSLGWEDKLDRAMAYLEESIKENGAIIREDCENVETALADLSEVAKEYIVHCVGHAHIDMNYQWGYHETVSITTETFRTMLTLMNEYPEFTFSQSQASVYEIVEKFDPAMLAEIRQRVHEGRWELAATQWVESDKNMPNGESLCRHIYYTKKYLAEIFDIDPDTLRIDYEPDTFGHNANVPEILQGGGVDYYYHCRGIDPRGPYRWQSPSGKEVIAYSEPSWYQKAIDYREFAYYPQLASKWGGGNMKEFLKVYGLGDHGGGPSRIDLEKLVDMMSWPLFPTLKFSRYDTYFDYLDTIRETLPVHVGEVNFVFGGCYTSQSRLKLANRLAELRLYDAEMLTAEAAALTGKLPQISLDRAWKNTMFNQFHDILPGSCVIETKEAALGYFQDTIGYTNTTSVEALRNIAAEMDTSALPFDNRVEVKEGGGMGYRLDRERGYTLAMAERGHGNVRILHLFNTTAYDRDDAITVQLWDYPDDINNLTAETADGTPVPLQVTAGNQAYFCNSFATVMLRVKVPALGYQTVIIKQRDEVDPGRFNLPATNGRRHDTFGDQNMLLENEYIRAEFDAETGTIVSLIDKESGTELVPEGDKTMGQFRLLYENPKIGHSAWTHGPTQKTDVINEQSRIRVSNYSRGPLTQWFSYDTSFGSRGSSLSVLVRLNAGSRTLDFDVHVNWLEIGNNDTQQMLTFSSPAAYPVAGYRYEIANGTIVREEQPFDVPSIGRMEMLPAEEGVPAYLQLMADTKYGFRGYRGRGEIALIHASFFPDPYPEILRHHFHTAIAVVRNGEEAQAVSDHFNHEIVSVAGRPHAGTLPLTDSFMKLSAPKGLNISGVHVDTDSTLIVRLYNRTNELKVTELAMNAPIEAAYYTDLTETADEPTIFEGNTVTVSIEPYATQTIKLRLAR